MMSKKMVNIFKYATKELSQDAFLMWLISNHDCDSKCVRETSYRLISKLISKTLKEGDIERVEIEPQLGKIDICAYIELKKDKNIFLAIEDKTFSNTSEKQLKKYSEFIDKKINKDDYIIKKVFYKSSPEDDNDIDTCKKFNFNYLFIDEIYELFNKNIYKDVESDFLNDYIEHIEYLYNYFYTYPCTPMSDWGKERNKFEAFFRTEFIEPYRENKNDDITYEMWSYQGKYAAFAVCKWFEGDLRFALMFIHRDNDNFFTAHIYLNVKPKIGKEYRADPKKINITQKLIEDNPLFIDGEKIIEITKITEKRHKQIARGNAYLIDKLNFSNDISVIKNNISLIIKWFLKISNNLDI